VENGGTGISKGFHPRLRFHILFDVVDAGALSDTFLDQLWLEAVCLF